MRATLDHVGQILGSLPRILDVAIANGLTEDSERGRKIAGWFFLNWCKDKRGELWMPFKMRLGYVPPTSPSVDYCVEKVLRIIQDNLRSSAESRNPERNEWGGGIRAAKNLVMAFSGLPEDADEAVVLVAAVNAGLMTLDEAREIAALSGNQKFAPLLRMCIA
ncbi:MAG: hypothetical protein AAB460_02170 [Patescibacteria group bacterium]